MNTPWVVPGAPLPNGSGWRVWYANIGNSPMPPASIEVSKNGRAIPTQPLRMKLVPSTRGFPRFVSLIDIELTTPQPGQEFDLKIPNTALTFRWRTSYDAIPPEGLSLVLASCFWLFDDEEGHYDTALDAVMKREDPRPTFRLNIGDQVYLDWPWPDEKAGDPRDWVAMRYQKYWSNESYRNALSRLPNIFVCDDHEFWNNYPEWQIQLPFAWFKDDRDKFERAAHEYYNAFQACLNPECKTPSCWIQLDIAPASFFIVDSRSGRTHNGKGDGEFLGKLQLEAIEEWQYNLSGPGILVLGQPLFDEEGDKKDYTLRNFREYAHLLNLIERSLRGENQEKRRHDILLLSGDIHCGRHAYATIPNMPGQTVHEFIASPLSRVGPFLRKPTPHLMKQPIRASLAEREFNWKVSINEIDRYEFPTIENNLGVVRLFLSERAPYKLRVQFRSYLVRPHRAPSWKVWERFTSPDMPARPGTLLYEYELNLV